MHAIIEDVYGGLVARVHAVGHRLCGHQIKWRTNAEPWIGCFGDIECVTCHTVFWCRHNRVWQWIARHVCAVVGHPGWHHPTEGGSYNNATNTIEGGTPILRDWCCTRCAAWFEDRDTEPGRHA